MKGIINGEDLRFKIYDSRLGSQSNQSSPEVSGRMNRQSYESSPEVSGQINHLPKFRDKSIVSRSFGTNESSPEVSGQMNRQSILIICLMSGLHIVALYAQQNYINSIGMEFVNVHAGELIIGRFQPTVSRMVAWGSDQPLDEWVYHHAVELAAKDATPGFRVVIPVGFYIGKFEVTQGHWNKIMRRNPSYFHRGKTEVDSDQHPVENIKWTDANRFIKKLNIKEHGKVRYRLPSEFEWEYAARAGKPDDISWSDIQSSAVIATHMTRPVGQKRPNDWGIYDMLGNVWEWVQDVYNEKMFADSTPLMKGKQHVLKGSSFYGDVKNATYMTHAGGPGSGYDTGFRLVMEIISN